MGPFRVFRVLGFSGIVRYISGWMCIHWIHNMELGQLHCAKSLGFRSCRFKVLLPTAYPTTKRGSLQGGQSQGQRAKASTYLPYLSR